MDNSVFVAMQFTEMCLCVHNAGLQYKVRKHVFIFHWLAALLA